MRRPLSFAILLLALSAPVLGPAQAKNNDDVPPTPAAYQALIDCKPLTDSAARLACYDQKVEAMATAIRDRQLVVADRETMREARRGLFGISLPRLRLFGGDDDTEEIKQIESAINAVRSAGDGMAIFMLADGSRWKQTEGRDVFAKAGDEIKIKRTAMGGYMANVDGQAAVRVMRLAN